MSLVALFLTAWVVGFTGAAAPGPISTLVVTESGRRGFWAGPLLTLGHALAEFALVLGLAFGLRSLLANARITPLIALVGGAFLVWMGIGTLRDALRRGSNPLAAAQQGKQTRLGPAFAGLFASLANPYWFLWWSTVGASYVVISLEQGPRGLAAFYSGHILSDLSWNSLLSFLMASGRRWLPQKAVQGFLALAGLFLVGLGGYFVYSGLGQIL